MLTVIIPALNASSSLGMCLAEIKGASEIIVVDGGSTDHSVDIARRGGARVIIAPRGRGQQLRAGGVAAQGDWLLFLHADTRLGPDWQAAIAAHVSSTPEFAGFFDLRLDDTAWQARIVEYAVAMRVALFGLPYGDQGLLISRELYNELGGYKPIVLMEDVDIARRIGLRRLVRLNSTALTSADRWRRDGWLRRSIRNLCCLGLYAVGVDPNQIAQFYR